MKMKKKMIEIKNVSLNLVFGGIVHFALIMITVQCFALPGPPGMGFADWDLFEVNEAIRFSRFRMSILEFPSQPNAPNFQHQLEGVHLIPVDSCKSNLLASAVTRDSGPAFVRVCPGFTKYSIEVRLGILVHESFHFSPKDHGHVTCSQGENEGSEGSCDAQFREGNAFYGAYGFEIGFLVWMPYRRALENEKFSNEIVRSNINYGLSNRFNKISNTDFERFYQK